MLISVVTPLMFQQTLEIFPRKDTRAGRGVEEVQRVFKAVLGTKL